MATVSVNIPVEGAKPASSNGAQHSLVDGTNFPIHALAFDPDTQETAFFYVGKVRNYGSGNLSLNIGWRAASASSGNVIFGAALACVTPNSDTQDMETKAFATATEVTDSHLGTTGKRDHEATIALSNLDSIANGDDLFLRLYRKAADAGDTMTGDALVHGLELQYSDA